MPWLPEANEHYPHQWNHATVASFPLELHFSSGTGEPCIAMDSFSAKIPFCVMPCCRDLPSYSCNGYLTQPSIDESFAQWWLGLTLPHGVFCDCEFQSAVARCWIWCFEVWDNLVEYRMTVSPNEKFWLLTWTHISRGACHGTMVSLRVHVLPQLLWVVSNLKIYII